MRRRIVGFLLAVLICGVVPQINIYAEPKDETEAKMTPEEYFKTLTPKAVLERANKDIEELYGLKNFYPTQSNGRMLNTELLEQQISEAIKDPGHFTGFDIVYGTSHGKEITHKGKVMTRYSGYNVFGDDVSTVGFPWDAGWSGTQIQNFNLKPTPWIGKNISKKFDDFPTNFGSRLPEKLTEYLGGETFEGKIIEALNAEYGDELYGTNLMYNNQNKQYENRIVYNKNTAPKGGWIKYVHVIQPPTYLSQGFGRVYLKVGTYMDVPIAAFMNTKPNDISAEFVDLPSGAMAGEEVQVSVWLRSTFPKRETTKFSWSVTRKSDGLPLTVAENQLKFSGGVAAESGEIGISKTEKRRLTVSFVMPESDVRIQFKVNEEGKEPEEVLLDNNVLDSDVLGAVKLIVPRELKLPYDMLTKKEKIYLPSSTATLQLPDLTEAKWTGNATGKLTVTNLTKELQKDFEIHNNPEINEASSVITRTPIVTYTIRRVDYGDDPMGGNWLNLDKPGTPLSKTGEVHTEGSVSRPYEYKNYYTVCTGEGENRKCEEKSETLTGTATAQFLPNTVSNTYDMYVYNGMKDVPKRKYRDEIEDNQTDSVVKKLFWTNEPYDYDVIRWMHHQDVEGKKYDWTQAPGQYKREFIQQASGSVEWDIKSSMRDEYTQARDAAAKRKNNKKLYDKAVFATDKVLQEHDYPIKSGYYFNPAGSYTFTVTTEVFKKEKPEDMTGDHKDLLNSLIDSFRYETDLMFINKEKDAVNINNVELAKKGGGFERKPGILSVKDSKSVNETSLISVLDRSKDSTRYTKEVKEIKYTDKRGGDSDKFWKMVLEGYSESYTLGKYTDYTYREYVKAGQHMYKITETSTITIVVNSGNIPLYTHANMPNGNYYIKVWFDEVNMTKGNHAYKGLEPMQGVENLDSIKVTVVGSMFDDLNN
ncbi:hypothetical protein M3201_23200 [Paenibacillus motobuensis]|uniref:hypothetical protein n=1 Tax=Paenibacillus TaxID=44249 RepID=UPI00203F93E3|nr:MULTISPECIES: hypothetical protein [Paenibacillus]MCM3042566.1 hypothetical protein [Paenibacillus lutimineralis]MCM3649670.1 hypothetical protein [Paenibacillus motobuensis]